jgi:hypothetical protein
MSPVVIIVIAVPVVVVITRGCGYCDQRQRGDGRRGFSTLVVWMIAGVVPAFHHKLGSAAVIHPNASAVIVPGPALLAI